MTGHIDPVQLARMDEALPEARRQLMQHLRGCAGCREAWLAEDPSRIFGLLALDSADGDALEALSRRVALHTGPVPRRQARGSWLSLAAALLLASLFGTYLWVRDRPSGAGAVVATALPRPEKVEERVVARDANTFELLAPQGAEVVRFESAESRVFMIFDESLGL